MKSLWGTASFLLTTLTLSPAARATTYASVDGHPNPVSLVEGETVTIHFDVAQAGGNVQYTLARDMAGTGTFDPAAPLAENGSITDGGTGDGDPTPGKVGWR